MYVIWEVFGICGSAGQWERGSFFWWTAGSIHVRWQKPPCSLEAPTEQPGKQKYLLGIRVLSVCLCQHLEAGLQHVLTARCKKKGLQVSFTLPLYTDFPGRLQSKDQSCQSALPDTRQGPQASSLRTTSGWRDEPKHTKPHVHSDFSLLFLCFLKIKLIQKGTE